MGTHDLVAAQYMEKMAKRKHLKAIDFTLGLLRRLKAMGKKLPGGKGAVVMQRLIDLRKLSQSKAFLLDTIFDNKALLSGKGKSILKILERDEAKLLPNEKHLAGFVKDFPNKVPTAQEAQAKKWAALIASKTSEPLDSVEDRVKYDWEFFQKAFDIVLPDILKAQAQLDSTIAPIVKGEYLGSHKAAPNTFKKQTREGESERSFLHFKDLARCMCVSPTVANMAEAAVVAQTKLDVLQKKNFYLKDGGYNAVHYFFQGPTVCEFQVKTNINAMEAALSHDLIYANEKAIIKLPQAEKDMVTRVIDVSTQLSMHEWGATFDIAMKLAMDRMVLVERVAFRQLVANLG